MPELLDNPPRIDPAAYSLESHTYENDGYRLVRFDGRYYVWLSREGLPDRVYSAQDEGIARSFLAGVRSQSLLTTPDMKRVETVAARDPAADLGLIYESAVIDNGDREFLVAVSDVTSGREYPTLDSFGELGKAIAHFAVCAEQAADRIERLQASAYPDVIAAQLRYRAAAARADAARIAAGNTIRSNDSRMRSERAVRTVAHAIGVSREFMYRILAEDEWA
jgi:hypothetical protein